MEKCWFNEERYDDEYKEIHVNCPRGVNGVMLPNNLTDYEYERYVSERNGEVTITHTKMHNQTQ